MMKKFHLLLLDANVVIELFRQGIWDEVVDRCDIHLARTVQGEAHFYRDEHGDRQDFDLEPYVQDGRIAVFDMQASEAARFYAQFDPSYMARLDDGETASLAYLSKCSEACWICSADSIVYRVLGNLNRAEQGISLEEVLQQVGLGRPLEPQFTRAHRERWSGRGWQEGIRGSGWRGDSTS